MTYNHLPVMLEEVLNFLKPNQGGVFFDGTLGGASYTVEIAKSIGGDGKLVATDLDPMAIKEAKRHLAEFGLENVFIFKNNFADLNEVVSDFCEQVKLENDKNGIFDGMVLDLGLSNAQLEDSSRGFSFRSDGDLNMSFAGDGLSAFEIVNSFSQEEISNFLYEYGEERYSRRIANKIIEKRKENKIKTSSELLEIISQAVPGVYKRGKAHFATKTFQALRIASNDELNNLKKFLPQALEHLKSEGVLVIVSYHSLEDRIVKNFFREEARDCICPKDFPVCQCEHKKRLKILTKKPLLPSEEEVARNRKSRSAKLRVAQKI